MSTTIYVISVPEDCYFEMIHVISNSNGVCESNPLKYRFPGDNFTTFLWIEEGFIFARDPKFTKRLIVPRIK